MDFRQLPQRGGIERTQRTAHPLRPCFVRSYPLHLVRVERHDHLAPAQRRPDLHFDERAAEGTSAETDPGWGCLSSYALFLAESCVRISSQNHVSPDRASPSRLQNPRTPRRPPASRDFVWRGRSRPLLSTPSSRYPGPAQHSPYQCRPVTTAARGSGLIARCLKKI